MNVKLLLIFTATIVFTITSYAPVSAGSVTGKVCYIDTGLFGKQIFISTETSVDCYKIQILDNLNVYHISENGINDKLKIYDGKVISAYGDIFENNGGTYTIEIERFELK